MVPGAAVRDEGEDDVDEAQEAASGGRLEPIEPRAGAVEEAPDRVGERDGALVRQSGERLSRPDGLELARRGGGRHLVDLDDVQPVGAGAAADREQLLQVLGRGGRTHRVEGALDSSTPHHVERGCG